ncbi:hypothetical protein EFW59_04141 [Bacillus subtilis]|nr:hypothetical protein EFW59_04141 [Bacillus subtilis]
MKMFGKRIRAFVDASFSLKFTSTLKRAGIGPALTVAYVYL